MSLASKIRKAGRLRADQWLLLVRASALLWRAAWLVRRRSMAELLTWTDSGSQTTTASQRTDFREISELVAAATRLALPAGSCLPQALVTCRLLKQAGYRASVVIGTKANQPYSTASSGMPFAAHAWVEVARSAASQAPVEFNRNGHHVLVKLDKTA